ncbi:hypothetical protein RBB50_005782 [Rhinocladiella similis]
MNEDTESWQSLWPKVAGGFGAKVPANVFPGGDYGQYDGFEASHKELPTPMPLRVSAEAIGLKDDFEGKHSVVHQQIDMTKWKQRPEVVKAWEMLRDKFSLLQDAWDKATWGLLTFLFGRSFSCVASMTSGKEGGMDRISRHMGHVPRDV